ncbi:MAG: LytR C-terminal domain-containing protein [Actinomycetaceae bacterium]|nr:LytR C-terminal domain-containing protein [Arcanobacterium sp.]MDD7504890.1 LytR C-terminal domain-containing protein [Actinomycetaceae bacterium]MDY6142726.1 LytR C-terminal domain-containing protein [Arcanobacterium sp.]
MVNNYKPDEFDALAAKRTTDGAHRQKGPSRTWLWALIAVLVLAPLAGVGIANLVGDSRQSAQNPSTTQQQPAEQKEPVPAEQTPEPQPETPAEPAPAPEPEADVSVEIRVLNGAGIRGLAASAVSVLEDAGFTSASAGDYTSSQPRSSAIFYSSADERRTASALGEVFGISDLREDPQAVAGDHAIVIVLRDQFDQAAAAKIATQKASPASS